MAVFAQFRLDLSNFIVELRLGVTGVLGSCSWVHVGGGWLAGEHAGEVDAAGLHQLRHWDVLVEDEDLAG